MKRKRVWPGVVRELVRRNPPSVTASDLAKITGSSEASASQVLSRLRRWGYVRLEGFANAPSGMGRRRHVYEPTDKARSYVEREEA